MGFIEIDPIISIINTFLEAHTNQIYMCKCACTLNINLRVFFVCDFQFIVLRFIWKISRCASTPHSSSRNLSDNTFYMNMLYIQLE